MIHRSILGEISVGDFSQAVYTYTLDNDFMSVDIMTFGAAITSIKLPDNDKKVDVVLGFSTLQGYQSDYNPYFGCVVGRVCNRISNGCFKVKKKNYRVAVNDPPNTLHGGFHGLDKKVWDVDVGEDKLCFSCISDHLEEGFPGYVEAKAEYELTSENELKLEMRAKTTHPTPICMTNHSYFNLAGHDTGWAGVKDHDLRINSDRYTPVDENMIPTGELATVRGTFLDLRTRRNLGFLINRSPANGYDHSYSIIGSGMRFFARTLHRKSGRVLEVYSDQPGMQFYTGNSLSNIPGKNKAVYNKHGGFCFETQNFPNAVNTPTFPNCILEPGEEYRHCVTYRFIFAQQT